MLRLPHPANFVRPDGQNDTDLVAAAIPRVGSAEVALSEGLDVVRGTFGAEIDDLPRIA
ncbi:MAG: hypothetical protein ACRDOK_08395 [Streptosporangiaceae bacterium]